MRTYVAINNYCLIYYFNRGLLKAVIVLLPVLGLTWIIGIIAVNNETQVFAWIFAILNSLQVNNIYQFYLHKLVTYVGSIHIYISCAEKQPGN